MSWAAIADQIPGGATFQPILAGLLGFYFLRSTLHRGQLTIRGCC